MIDYKFVEIMTNKKKHRFQGRCIIHTLSMNIGHG